MKTIKDTSTPAIPETAVESTSAAVAVAPAETREVPPLPGGGSWTFNEITWEWESNAPAIVAAAAETPSTTKE